LTFVPPVFKTYEALFLNSITKPVSSIESRLFGIYPSLLILDSTFTPVSIPKSISAFEIPDLSSGSKFVQLLQIQTIYQK